VKYRVVDIYTDFYFCSLLHVDCVMCKLLYCIISTSSGHI